MHPNRVGAILVLSFCTVYGSLIQEIGLTEFESTFSARSMPTFLCVLAVIYSLWLILTPGARTANQNTHMLTEMNWPLGFGFCLLMSGYGFGLRPLGFLLSTFLFLYIGFYLLGARRHATTLFTAGLFTISFWLLMTQLLDVYLPAWPEILL